MPHPQRLWTTLKRAVEAFQTTPGRRGKVVHLPERAEALVAGDLHGNVENFRLLLKAADLAAYPGRHLILQEIVHGPFRYPAGGDKSHQLVDLLAALKCQFPERVHFLIGNHELAQWQSQRIGKGDVDQNEIFYQGVEHAYGTWAPKIYAVYLELFAASNLAVRAVNRVLMTHSVPAGKHLANFDAARLEQDDFGEEDYRLGGLVHSLLWARDPSQSNAEAFLQKMDADLLLTGHIPCEQGYSVPNDRQIILDALGTPACYCLFPTDQSLTQQGLLDCIGVL